MHVLNMKICNNISYFLLLQNLPLLIILLFQSFPHTVFAGTPPYVAIENIAVNCGAFTDAVAQDGRRWTADTSHTSVSATTQPATKDQVPYLTACLSTSPFSYSFPVSTGPKFIRLHFYPATYRSDLAPSKSVFSIKTGDTTLLTNFSALLHAQGQETLMKEFIINVDDSRRLNLTFSPEGSGSYAFINGIEIVSMPFELYYGGVGDEHGIKLLSAGQVNRPYSIDNSSVMETVFRFNVGGIDISPNDDTGMYRHWPPDNDYVVEQMPGALPTNTSINLDFAVVPAFSAPPEVYKTARTMGLDKNVNKNYQLSWEFPVDSGFTYFVRLHFCEFQPEITKRGDRVFRVYIADFTAENHADVILWSGGHGVPTYRDYTVAIEGQRSERRNLSVELTPTSEWRTLYSDSILNGVEIFKLSNFGNFARPNTHPVQDVQPRATSTHEEPSTTMIATRNPVNDSQTRSTVSPNLGLLTLFIYVSRRVIIVCVVVSEVVLLLLSKIKSVEDKASNDGSQVPFHLCRHFSLQEIKAATNNFDQASIIGVGGFGNVYKGFIGSGATEAAFKRLNPESRQGAHEFKTEIELLSQLRHLHLISLIGYCNENCEMILVYDYMSRGTLRNHLYISENPPLPWEKRLEICIGAARGLEYLHTGTKRKIIHRDVKTTNILLDDNWVAKVSDFGLSKMVPTHISKDYISTEVKGTLGYLDPEYYQHHQLTEKSDVYSFGVVLLEVLCARPPINRMLDTSQVSLRIWAQHCYRNGMLGEIIDPYLKERVSVDCLNKFSEVAMTCLLDEGSKRPSMNDVVRALEFSLQLHESAVAERSVMMTTDDPSFGASDFSEIKNPQGR